MQSSTKERFLQEFMTSPPLTQRTTTEALPQSENKQGSSKRKHHGEGERLANVGLGRLRMRWGETTDEACGFGSGEQPGSGEQLTTKTRHYDVDMDIDRGIRMKIIVEDEACSFLNDKKSSPSPPLPSSEAPPLPPPSPPETPPSLAWEPHSLPVVVGSLRPPGSPIFEHGAVYLHENVVATWGESDREVKVGLGGEVLIQKSARLDIDMPFRGNTLRFKIMVERDWDGPHEQAYFDDIAKAQKRRKPDSPILSPGPVSLEAHLVSPMHGSDSLEADCSESQILPPSSNTDGEALCESQL